MVAMVVVGGSAKWVKVRRAAISRNFYAQMVKYHIGCICHQLTA